MADFASALLSSLGARATPENVRFVNAWIRAEGTRAGFNPLATTQVMGSPNNFNTLGGGIGVQNYPDFQTGLDATVKTLTNGRYTPIVSGLRSGNATAAQLAQAVADSPWGTGRGVLNVLGSGGGATPPASPSLPPAAAVPSAPSAPMSVTTSTPNIAGALLSSLGQSPGAQLNSIMGSIFNAPLSTSTTMPTSTKLPAAASVPTFKASDFKVGSPVPTNELASIGALHPTAGLDGFPAHDYMAKAGSAVVAPVGGTIVRLSGHDPSAGPTNGVHGPFGWSVYLRGDDGHTYYLTHMGSRDVKPGQKVTAGSLLGTVGDYAKWGGADHVHMGVD